MVSIHKIRSKILMKRPCKDRWLFFVKDFSYFSIVKKNPWQSGSANQLLQDLHAEEHKKHLLWHPLSILFPVLAVSQPSLSLVLHMKCQLANCFPPCRLLVSLEDFLGSHPFVSFHLTSILSTIKFKVCGEEFIPIQLCALSHLPLQ